MPLPDITDIESFVLKLIAPIVPTHIVYLGHGLFELRWPRKLESHELDSLQQNKAIQLRGDPFTPERFSSPWTAIRFIHHLKDFGEESED